MDRFNNLLLTYPDLTNFTIESIIHDDMIKRQEFSQYILTELEYFLTTKIHDIYNITNKYNCVLWIGGSRSWYNLFKDNNLDTIQKNSILPGNFDLFCVTNNPDDIKPIICKIKPIFDEIKTHINKHIYECFSSLKSQRRSKKCELIDINKNEYCVFEPCHSIHLRIDKDTDSHNVEFNCDKGKTLIYFECISLPNKIKFIHNKLLTEKNGFLFLNDFGVYLFSELILQDRNKGYNIDFFRKQIIEKLISQHPNKLFHLYIYKQLIKSYRKLFYKTDYYKDYNIKHLIISYIKLVNENIIKDFESRIIETLRRYVEFYILNHLQPFLHTNEQFIVAVGGDAIRQYVDNIKYTNDFDFKIYYNNKKNFNKLLQFVSNKLSLFVVYLFNIKHDIFKDLNIFINDSNISINALSNNNGQFRLRYIKQNPQLPIDLLSIDYRYYITIQIDNTIYKIKNEIPFIDIVLQYNKDKLEYHNVVNTNHYFPYASSEFLYKDISKTYNKLNEAKSRLLKLDKDKSRIEYLKYSIYNSYLKSLPKEHTVLKRKNTFESKNIPKKIKLYSTYDIDNRHIMSSFIDSGNKYFELFNKLLKKKSIIKYQTSFDDVFNLDSTIHQISEPESHLFNLSKLDLALNDIYNDKSDDSNDDNSYDNSDDNSDEIYKPISNKLQNSLIKGIENIKLK